MLYKKKSIVFKNSQVVTNIFYNLLGYVIPGFIAIITIPRLLSNLGSEMFGVLSLVWITISYFSVCDFGINKSITYNISKKQYGEKTDHKILSAGIILNLFISIIVVSLLYSFSDIFFQKIVNANSQVYFYGKQIYFLSLIFFPLIILTSFMRSILEGLNNFYVVNIGKCLSISGLYLFPLLIFYFFQDLKYVIVSVFLSKLIQFSIYFLYCGLKIVEIRKLSIPSVSVFKNIISFGGWFAIISILSPLIVYFDRYLLAYYFSFDMVSLYAVPYEISSKFIILSASINIAIFPILTRFINDKNGTNEYKKIKNIAIKTNIIVYVLLFLFILTFGEFIFSKYLGSSFNSMHFSIMKILAFGLIFNSLSGVEVTSLYSKGKTKICAFLYLAELPLYIFSLIMVIKIYNSLLSVAWVWSGRMLIDYVFFKLINIKIEKLNLKSA